MSLGEIQALAEQFWTDNKALTVAIGGGIVALIAFFNSLVDLWKKLFSKPAQSAPPVQLPDGGVRVLSYEEDQEREKRIVELQERLRHYEEIPQEKREEAAAKLDENPELAIGLLKELASHQEPQVQDAAQTQFDLGNAYFINLNYPEALAAYYKAVGYAPENPVYLAALSAQMLYMGQYQEAIFLLEGHLAKLPPAYLEAGYPIITTLWNNLGGAYGELGRHKEAIVFYKKILKITLEKYGNDHSDVALALNNIGRVYINLGRHKEALKFHKKALILNQRIYGNEHRFVSKGWGYIASIYCNIGEYEKAIDLCYRALNVERALFGNEHPNLSEYLAVLSWAYGDLGQHEMATDCRQKALNIDRKVFGDGHLRVAKHRNQLAKIYSKLGRKNEACDLLRKVIRVYLEYYGKEDTRTKDIHYGLAQNCPDAQTDPE